MRPKRELLRVVRTPDGRVVTDETGRMAGRGAYVCADGDCAANAARSGVLARALEAAIPDELRTQLRGHDKQERMNDTRTNEGGARGEE